MGQRFPNYRRLGRSIFFRVFRVRHKETKKPPVKRVANEFIIGVDRGAVKRTGEMIRVLILGGEGEIFADPRVVQALILGILLAGVPVYFLLKVSSHSTPSK